MTKTGFATKCISSICFGLLISCSSTLKNPPQEYFDIQFILNLMMNSPIKYTIQMDSTISGTDISRLGNQDQTFNSNLYKVSTGEHSATILDHPGNNTVLPLIEAAEKMYNEKKYDSAIAIHQKARAAEPTYFKTYTLIGDSYYSKGQYDSAIAYFKMAMHLNPYDYQAAWFMSDAFQKKQQGDSAFKYLIRAWAINKNNKEINILMLQSAKALNYSIIEDRTRFHFEIDRKSAEEIAVKYKNGDAMEELGLANCLAGVEGEPKLAKLKENTKSLYANCLINLDQGLRNMIKTKPVKYAINKRMLGIVDDHFFTAYLVWEILDNQDPHAILYQDESEIENVEKYIWKYVLKKNGV